MELQLLVIFAVALLVFGPEKMMQFAVELGRFLRKAKQEWAKIQMEIELQGLKKEWQQQAKEGEEKVKKYLFGENTENKSEEGEKNGKTQSVSPQGTTLEDLVKGNAPILEEEKEHTKGK